MANVILKDVYKSFGKNEVIHGISCDIKDGESIESISNASRSTTPLLMSHEEDTWRVKTAFTIWRY